VSFNGVQRTYEWDGWGVNVERKYRAGIDDALRDFLA
jgi:hypothetical protein